MKSKTVGFIGIGEMGLPMSKNIMKAGFELTAYDIRKEALETIMDEGAKMAESPLELARSSEVIITILPSASAVREVILGEKGVLAALTPRHVVVEMSTIDIGTTMELARAVKSKGSAFIDSPVSGTPEMVERREAGLLASGDKEIIDECKEIFEALAKRVVYTGKIGNGKIMKLASNLLIGINKLAVTEAICLALKQGIDPEVILEVIRESNGNSTVFQRYGAAVIDETKGIAKKHSWQLKDLGLVLESCRQTSTPLLLGSLAHEITQASSNESGAAEDFESIVKFYKRLMKTMPEGSPTTLTN